MPAKKSPVERVFILRVVENFADARIGVQKLPLNVVGRVDRLYQQLCLQGTQLSPFEILRFVIIRNGVFFFTGPPPEKFKYGKPRLGVSRMSKIHLTFPNLGFPYFSGGSPVKKTPCNIFLISHC